MKEKLDLAGLQMLQKELHRKYLEKWGPLCPGIGRDTLLWMMGEAGELADIIKKKGDNAIMEDPDVRHDFMEEMCDVLMYFNDLMLCYSIAWEELADIYLEKHERNMKRW